MRTWRRLAATSRALAGLEFALALPLMLALLAGLVDGSLAIITSRRLSAAADAVALIASTLAVQAAGPNTLSGAQAGQATTAPFAIFPQWRQPGGTAAFSITLSEVDFAGAPASMTARTRWSMASTLGQTALRPCGVLAPVADGSAPSLTTLPAGAFGPTSVLVGDVSTLFVPLFSSVFTGPVAMLRSAYVPPRLNVGVRLTGAGPGPTVICPQPGS